MRAPSAASSDAAASTARCSTSAGSCSTVRRVGDLAQRCLDPDAARQLDARLGQIVLRGRQLCVCRGRLCVCGDQLVTRVGCLGARRRSLRVGRFKLAACAFALAGDIGIHVHAPSIPARVIAMGEP